MDEDTRRNDGVVLLYATHHRRSINDEGSEGIILVSQQIREDDPAFHINNMQRGRLQRLLSTTIFICFFILFLDGHNQTQRLSRTKSKSTSPQSIDTQVFRVLAIILFRCSKLATLMHVHSHKML
jgi:hypothetical protein